jgi:hypothetical protein
MRKRAYRPEVHDCLEDRSLLSGVAADPVVFPRRQLVFVTNHMRSGFALFARQPDFSQLHAEIDDVVPKVPFGRVDGLESSIVSILDRMRHEISAHVPNAFRSAMHDVIAITVAGVKARVRAGELIVR